MSPFASYLLGFAVVIIGLALAAFYIGVPHIWIAIGVIVLVGFGILTATTKTRMKEPPNQSS